MLRLPLLVVAAARAAIVVLVARVIVLELRLVLEAVTPQASSSQVQPRPVSSHGSAKVPCAAILTPLGALQVAPPDAGRWTLVGATPLPRLRGGDAELPAPTLLFLPPCFGAGGGESLRFSLTSELAASAGAALLSTLLSLLAEGRDARFVALPMFFRRCRCRAWWTLSSLRSNPAFSFRVHGDP